MIKLVIFEGHSEAIVLTLKQFVQLLEWLWEREVLTMSDLKKWRKLNDLPIDRED